MLLQGGAGGSGSHGGGGGGSGQHARDQQQQQQPQFSKVYDFLGGLFDPSAASSPTHKAKLDSMSSVDREVVQVLMYNLASKKAARPLCCRR